jgi:hypothetical protein
MFVTVKPEDSLFKLPFFRLGRPQYPFFPLSPPPSALILPSMTKTIHPDVL